MIQIIFANINMIFDNYGNGLTDIMNVTVAYQIGESLYAQPQIPSKDQF